MSIKAQCEQEVTDLHRFFEQWYLGELDNTDEVFARFESVIAAEFHLVTPEGVIIDRPTVLAMVKNGHPTATGKRLIDKVNYWIKHQQHHHTLGDLAVVTYEEWQNRGGNTRGRLSTAVMRAKPGAPNGVEWLHVHETWLPE